MNDILEMNLKMMNCYKLYVHINKENGKSYVGVTMRDLNVRWGKDGRGYKDQPKFYNAIQKYGWDNFEHIILLENLDEVEAFELESLYIQKYNSIENGYNILSKSIGSFPRNKKVYCLTTKTLYNSIKEAAQDTQSQASRIINSCKGKNGGTKGLQWAYWDEEKNTFVSSAPFIKKPIPTVEVYCVELNTYYSSIADVCRKLKLDKSGMIKALSGKRNGIGGYHFVRTSEMEKIPEIMKKKTGNKRRVYCKEKDLFFGSLSEAASFAKVTEQAIMKNCQGLTHSCAGYHFLYQEDVDFNEVMKRRLQKEEKEE